VPSLLAAIGEVIETHMIRTGFLQSDEARLPLARAKAEGDLALGAAMTSERPVRLKLCPRCSSAAYTQREGCWVCDTCGFSRCG
jgi:ribonucleoside-diphosphate reductase alpha chain